MILRGAIFDMDGVLVDNIEHHLRAWKQLGSEMGRRFEENHIRSLFGQRNREILSGLIGQEISDGELKRLGDRKEELYRDVMRPNLRPVPGLPDFLAALRRGGIRAAVATSGPIPNVDFVLQGIGLASAFDVIVTGPDVPRSKPYPDIFLCAAERLGLRPADCAVFEDSPPGIQAAKAAGCLCIGIATTHTPEELKEHQPDIIVRDFTELTVDRIVAV